MSLSDHLSRLATSDPVQHITHVDYSSITSMEPEGNVWQPMPDPRSCTVTFDETTRPFARATLTWAQGDWDQWNKLTPTATNGRPAIKITTGYTWPRTGDTDSEQLSILIVTGMQLDESNASVSVTAESSECLLENDYVRPGRRFDIPSTASSLTAIWALASAETLPLWFVPVIQRSPIPYENLAIVRALALESGDSFAEWLWNLADAAGHWLHSDQSPTSTGSLIAEERHVATRPVVDLSPSSRHPIIIRRQTTHSLDEYASVVDITAHWIENGEDQQTSQRFVAPSGTPHAVKRDINLRPTLVNGQRQLLPNWAPGQALVNRMSLRDSIETIDARACYWLRPRDTIRTSAGSTLIRSITFDTSTGLMTLTARPY